MLEVPCKDGWYMFHANGVLHRFLKENIQPNKEEVPKDTRTYTCNLFLWLIWCCATILAATCSRWRLFWSLWAAEEGSKGKGRIAPAAQVAAAVAVVVEEVAVAITVTDVFIRSSMASAPIRSSYQREKELEEAPAEKQKPVALSTTPTLSRGMLHHLNQTFPARRSSSSSTSWRTIRSGYKR